MRNKRGITLIALVITIIVLIILAGVAIYLALGNNGILNKAEQAKNETTKQTATEKMNLKITNMQIEKYAEEQRMPTLQEFSDGLCEDDEIQYVELQSKKVGSLSKIEVGNASSIFTKLKEYPYEFEINSSLQLASIDGIQVATSNTVTISKEEYDEMKSSIEELKNETIDYSKNENYIDVSVNSKIDTGWKNDISGPQISSGTWNIMISISSDINASHQSTVGGTGCHPLNTNAWSGSNQTIGFYKGEATTIKAKVYNGYSGEANYTIRFRAVKISNTY